MTQQDIPALIEQCRGQMQQCIDRMEHEPGLKRVALGPGTAQAVTRVQPE